MGIARITYAIGGSIVAIAMVIGMFTIVADTTTPSASTLGLYGHYVIKISDSDGNLKTIIQTDNAPTHHLKDCLFDGFFAGGVASASCDVSSIDLAIGDAGEIAPDVGDLDLGFRYVDSGNGTATQTAATPSTSGATTVVYSHGVLATHITVTQTDLDASLANIALTDGECNDDDLDGATECKIDEVGLFDANGRLLSHAAFAPSVEVNNGDTVDMELTITIT